MSHHRTTDPALHGTAEQDHRLRIARDLEHRWSAQQTGYIRHRSARFATMARVVGDACHDLEHPRVLDLAGGTGSLAAAVLHAVPGAEVVIADKDPVLLAVARDLVPDRPGSSIAQVDLDDPSWVEHEVIAQAPYDAVVSSTALHWLQPEVLTAVYRRLADLVRPGGIVLNGDHLHYDRTTQPVLHEVAARDDARVQREAFAQGEVDTWDSWWEAVAALPQYADAVSDRRRVWGAERDTAPPKVTLGFHLEALRSAGFAETGTVWRYLDDVVLYAVR